MSRNEAPRSTRILNIVLVIILILALLAAAGIYYRVNQEMSYGQPGDTVCDPLQIAAMLRWEDRVDQFDEAYEVAARTDLVNLSDQLDVLEQHYQRARDARYPYCAQTVRDAGLEYMQARLTAVQFFYDGMDMEVVRSADDQADSLYLDYLNAEIAILEANDE